MNHPAALFVAVAMFTPPAAIAAVKSSDAHSFTVDQSVVVQVPPARAWRVRQGRGMGAGEFRDSVGRGD